MKNTKIEIISSEYSRCEFRWNTRNRYI